MPIYLLPLLGDGTKGDPRRPAYIATDAPALNYTLMDFGTEPVCLLHMIPSDSQDTALKAHADVFALPANLNQVIGGQLAAVQNALATFNIPEDWVQATMTYRRVLHVVALACQVMQRLAVFLPTRLFAGGVTLATRLNQLPVGTRMLLQQAAVDLGLDTAGLTGASTLRTVLKNLADQVPLETIYLGDEVLT